MHCISLNELETWHDAAVFVEETGVIVAIEKDMDLQRVKDTIIPQLGWVEGEYTLKRTKQGEFFFPGFIGMYIS